MLAGLTISYRPTAHGGATGIRLAVPGDHDGSPGELYARLSTTLPKDARPVPLSGTDAKAWTGKDPATGANALFVKASTGNGGRLFSVVAPGWTTDQLVDLLKHARPVPATS
jgi:hypothetical protein